MSTSLEVWIGALLTLAAWSFIVVGSNVFFSVAEQILIGSSRVIRSAWHLPASRSGLHAIDRGTVRTDHPYRHRGSSIHQIFQARSLAGVASEWL